MNTEHENQHRRIFFFFFLNVLAERKWNILNTAVNVALKEPQRRPAVWMHEALQRGIIDEASHTLHRGSELSHPFSTAAKKKVELFMLRYFFRRSYGGGGLAISFMHVFAFPFLCHGPSFIPCVFFKNSLLCLYTINMNKHNCLPPRSPQVCSVFSRTSAWLWTLQQYCAP